MAAGTAAHVAIQRNLIIALGVGLRGKPCQPYGSKRAEYQATPSVKRYVVLQQSSASAVVFCRDSAEWATDLLTGGDAVLDMTEIGLQIPLAEIYAGIELEPAAGDVSA